MNFIFPNSDIFVLQQNIKAKGPIEIEETAEANAQKVNCDITYRPSGSSSSIVQLRWNRISNDRYKLGDKIDLSVVIIRDGSAIGADTLDIEFPVEVDSIYDADFATVAAASFQCHAPHKLAGVELLICNEFGPQSALPIAVKSIGHGATGHQFSAKPNSASIAIRLHLPASDKPNEKLSIKIGRVFLGLQFNPNIFNPWYEHSVHVNKFKPTPGFEKIAKEFISAARLLSKQHKFSASQSFIMPFEVTRVGTPSFPMLCGTVNSLFWYGLTVEHGIENFAGMGFVLPGDVVLDCGAHAGQMSALFGLLVGKTGKVIAFEPFPQNYLQVEAQAKLNKLTWLKSARAGVGEKCETVRVPNAVQMILANSHDHGLKDHLDITISTIDDYLHLQPTAIKLDIEGAEVAALRGAQRVLRECSPKIFCEFHTQLVGQFGHTVQDFFDAIPLELYDVTFSEEGKDGAWQVYDGSQKQVWSMPGTIIALPKAKTQSTNNAKGAHQRNVKK